MSECDKSADGKHEMDMENVRYERHVGHHVAVYAVNCRHCGLRGEVAIDARECDWDEVSK